MVYIVNTTSIGSIIYLVTLKVGLMNIFSFESSTAKDFKEEDFFSSAGRAFHNFVPNAGNIQSMSLVRVLISGKLLAQP